MENILRMKSFKNFLRSLVFIMSSLYPIILGTMARSRRSTRYWIPCCSAPLKKIVLTGTTSYTSHFGHIARPSKLRQVSHHSTWSVELKSSSLSNVKSLLYVVSLTSFPIPLPWHNASSSWNASMRTGTLPCNIMRPWNGIPRPLMINMCDLAHSTKETSF